MPCSSPSSGFWQKISWRLHFSSKWENISGTAGILSNKIEMFSRKKSLGQPIIRKSCFNKCLCFRERKREINKYEYCLQYDHDHTDIAHVKKTEREKEKERAAQLFSRWEVGVSCDPFCLMHDRQNENVVRQPRSCHLVVVSGAVQMMIMFPHNPRQGRALNWINTPPARPTRDQSELQYHTWCHRENLGSVTGGYCAWLESRVGEILGRVTGGTRKGFECHFIHDMA